MMAPSCRLRSVRDDHSEISGGIVPCTSFRSVCIVQEQTTRKRKHKDKIQDERRARENAGSPTHSTRGIPPRTSPPPLTDINLFNGTSGVACDTEPAALASRRQPRIGARTRSIRGIDIRLIQSQGAVAEGPVVSLGAKVEQHRNEPLHKANFLRTRIVRVLVGNPIDGQTPGTVGIPERAPVSTQRRSQVRDKLQPLFGRQVTRKGRPNRRTGRGRRGWYASWRCGRERRGW